jgi:hypothetical protein
MSNLKRQKRQSREELDAELLERINRVSNLDSWNSFVESINVPGDMLPALMTGRPELLRIVKGRVLTADECTNVYKLVAVLIETNMALREHSQLVAQLTSNLLNGFTAIHSAGKRIDDFANFRIKGIEENDEGAGGESEEGHG